jgi:hypothetical protein
MNPEFEPKPRYGLYVVAVAVAALIPYLIAFAGSFLFVIATGRPLFHLRQLTCTDAKSSTFLSGNITSSSTR